MPETKSVDALSQQLDDHLVACADKSAAVERRLGRIEAGMIAALVGIVIVLWQGYSSTHPAIVTVSAPATATTTTTTTGPSAAPVRRTPTEGTVQQAQ